MRRVVLLSVSVMAALVAIPALAKVALDKPQTANMVPQVVLMKAVNDAGNFKTFQKLLVLAGMESVLTDPAPHTLFMPTDAAFAKMDKGHLASLMKPENKAQLVELVNLHIVNGAVDRKTLDNRTSEVLTGTLKRLEVVGHAGELTVNGHNIGKADLKAANGVVYALDTVIEGEAVKPALLTVIDTKVTPAADR